jgi:hypothetical protein
VPCLLFVIPAVTSFADLYRQIWGKAQRFTSIGVMLHARFTVKYKQYTEQDANHEREICNKIHTLQGKIITRYTQTQVGSATAAGGDRDRGEGLSFFELQVTLL